MVAKLPISNATVNTQALGCGIKNFLQKYGIETESSPSVHGFLI
jgi:hypothetical protein